MSGTKRAAGRHVEELSLVRAVRNDLGILDARGACEVDVLVVVRVEDEGREPVKVVAQMCEVRRVGDIVKARKAARREDNRLAEIVNDGQERIGCPLLGGVRHHYVEVTIR